MSGSGKHLRIGIDLGGTKIEGLAIDGAGEELTRIRVDAPREDYAATVEAVSALVSRLRTQAEAQRAIGAVRVGIGMPGSISPASGLVQNANSTWLNGQRFDSDLTEAVGLPLRFANDANCFALSEAIDGAAKGARSVFGVILGTGTGGGIVVDGRILNGPRGIGGEWGHNPLPWPTADEHFGPQCWCGRQGCIEAWVSGPGLAGDHCRNGGAKLSAQEVAENARGGDSLAIATLQRHTSRLARGLAHVINVIDPDVIVLGGGLSKLTHLYRDLPDAIAPHLFTDAASVDIRPPRWGDASGVRGAAWLWEA